MASYAEIFLVLIYLTTFNIIITNGLKCYMCGEYNEGVGSITPCLNYSDQYKHLYLRSCTKDSEKYCVVSKNKLIKHLKDSR